MVGFFWGGGGGKRKYGSKGGGDSQNNDLSRIHVLHILITRLTKQEILHLLYLPQVVQEQAAVQKERAVLMTTWCPQVV